MVQHEKRLLKFKPSLEKGLRLRNNMSIDTNRSDISRSLLQTTNIDRACPPEEVFACNQRNQFFETLISSLPGIFYLIDDTRKVLRWSNNAQGIGGISEKEISEIDLFDLIIEEDRETLKAVIDRGFVTGETAAEIRVVGKGGSHTPYFFTGVITNIGERRYLLGIGLDISKFKEAESSLQESVMLYTLFAENMPEGVVLLRNYQSIFANNVFISILGYDNFDQLTSVKLTDVVAETDLADFMELYASLEKGLYEKRDFHIRALTKNGDVIWVSGRGTVVQWQGERTVFLMVRDITEAKLRILAVEEEAERLRRENLSLRSSINERYRFGEIIGKSSLMQAVYESILNAARVSASVIVTGESGTGKELVASAIHQNSDRNDKNFVTVNCAAIPENLLESEFFGHKKGAFTGATSDRLGYLKQADGGTLFLDEVAELNLNLQAKLLRALDGGGFIPVGGNLQVNSDFRIVAATNRDLEECLRKGMIRQDFYYRIHIIPISLPPLRTRREDIPLLVEHFLSLYKSGDEVPTISGVMMESLVDYPWKGNVRELRNTIQRYIAEKNLDFILLGHNQASVGSGEAPVVRRDQSLREQVNHLEKAIIEDSLSSHKGNRSKTATALGITRKTLFRKMISHGL